MFKTEHDGSPYARALGARITELHPALRRYFSSVPLGQVGRGEGVFSTVGCRRRWLQPLLGWAERRGAIVAGWAEQVPFHIENRTVGGRAMGLRRFDFPDRRFDMRDSAYVTTEGRIVDHIGSPMTISAEFDVDVCDGALHLTSTRSGIALGRLRMSAPRWFSPSIQVREGFDDTSGRQRISLTVDLPLVGRVYEYAGAFTYRIVRAER